MTQKGAGQTWIGCLLLRVGTRQESEDAYKTFLRCTLAAGLAAAVEGSWAPRANVKCQIGVIRAAAGAAGNHRGSPCAGTSAHPGSDKDHIAFIEMGENFFNLFFSCGLADFRTHPGAKATGDGIAKLKLFRAGITG